MIDRSKSWLVALAIAAGAAGCGKKSDSLAAPPPEVTGLSAVPASAEVVIGADVSKLLGSPIIERAVDQLLLRDTTLSAAWAQVRDGCKIDFPKQVKRVMLALGPAPAGGRPGTGPALMIATGSLPEADLSACLGKLVGKGGGAVTGKPAGGKTIYEVKDGARVMYFAFGRPDTVVLGTNEAYVLEAIGAGKKALDHPELSVWLKLVDQNAPIWAVGRVDERVRKGLVGVLEGLRSGPAAVVGSIDPTSGMKLELGAVMSSADDAKHLEAFVNDSKTLIAMAAQAKGLGSLVNKVAITSDSTVVRFKAALDMADVNHLLSMLDGRTAAAQDAAPGSGK